jgi:hypothetical protein
MQTTTLALEHLLCAVGDPVAELRGIGPEHPEYARAQTIRAAAGVLAKIPDALPAIERATRDADDLPLSARARSHVSAAQAWLRGDPLLAAETYAFILARWPFDLLALRLAHSCYFFLGRHRQLCEVIDAVEPQWSDDRPGFRFLLAMASFAHAESGDATRAETLGRRALAYEPGCPMGVHAVAHALAEAGRYREGAQWMRDQRAHWATKSRMRSHNAWHLAMFDVETGNVGSALEILDRCLLPASTQSPLDACDAAGLLWRLKMQGVDSRRRWRRLSAAFERSTAGFWPYVDLHAGLAHLCAGRKARAKRLAQTIDRCAQGEGYAALRARMVTQPGLQALESWIVRRHADTARLVDGMVLDLSEAGGSRIQLAVFKSIRDQALQSASPGSSQAILRRAQTPQPFNSTQQGDAKWKQQQLTTDHAFAAQYSSP